MQSQLRGLRLRALAASALHPTSRSAQSLARPSEADGGARNAPITLSYPQDSSMQVGTRACHKVRVVWRRAHSNGDGALDADEFHQLIPRISSHRPAFDHLAELFDRIDTSRYCAPVPDR